jgi:hypothetical protein
MPEEPRRHKYTSMEEAIEKLNRNWKKFSPPTHANPGMTLINPVFGDLDYELQIHLLHKHVRHHLAQ